MTRNSQRGSAMLVTMIIIAALLAGAAVLASMSLSSNRSTELTRNGLAALYCAEAGLSSTRATVSANLGNWDAALVANCAASSPDPLCRTLVEPSWITALDRDIDDDGSADFTVSIRDDDDEPGTQAPADDVNDTVFVVARCIKYPDSPRVVEQLLTYKPAANPYGCQGGGVNSRGNDNDNRVGAVGGDCSEGAD